MAMSRSQFLTLMVEGLREVFFLQYKEQELHLPIEASGSVEPSALPASD